MTCCEATSSAVFDGCRQVVSACLRRISGAVYLRQLASRAAEEACCTSPLEFSRDKRGRLRELLANIVNRIPPSLDFGSLQFSAGPAHWSYDGGPQRPAGALRIQSARIAPDPACVVSLDDWPLKSIAHSVNSPAATGEPNAPSFFKVSMSQWRSVVRRMVRCKWAVALPSDTWPVQLSGGAFAVPKDADRDRLICDRRPQNSQEPAVSCVLLPFCPRLRRLILQQSQALGVHIVDRSHWHTQVTGPRIPASWLHHIEDDTCNDTSQDVLELWWEPDLRQSSGSDEPHDGHRQSAAVGVMMGDTSAVSVLEMAHRRLL